MKINVEFKKSLAKQYATLMGIAMGSFIVGTVILWLSLHLFNNNYSRQIELLEEKEYTAQRISNSFNTAFSDARGYFAYNNPLLRDNALLQGTNVSVYIKKFSELATTEEDQEFLNSASQFSQFYFEQTLPNAIQDFENGRLDKVVLNANTNVTAKVKSFQADSQTYIDVLEVDLDNSFKRLSKLQTYVQIGFVLFILLILMTLLRITQVMLRKVGQPLSQLARAANELANGKEVPLSHLDTTREDELGALSTAFHKMVETVQDKEQDLMAQNEELLAQQDELQAQQMELEETLEILKVNEIKLQKRNEMINKITNSLNKQEVLDSIIVNICKIIDADCGMIKLLGEDVYSSYGVSAEGIVQFNNNISRGLSERLLVDKMPFTIKRELGKSDKGYHELVTYSFDLYLPVLSSTQELVAILVFSRFSEAFPESQMDEYIALTRNIALSLDKIKLFEQSEEDRTLNQEILNTIQEGIQLVNRSGEIVQANRQLKEMFSWQQSDKIVGLNWSEWISIMSKDIDDKVNFTEFVENAVKVKQNNQPTHESYIYEKQNPYQVIKVYCKALFHGDEKIGTIFVHRDITKEHEVDQMKSEFVSTVSHELRTPLASILGFTELMLNRDLKPDRQQKYLSTIYSEAKRLTALINDFLDVQRMESGKQTYEKKFINLIPILEKVVENQQISTNQHQIQLMITSLEDLILGDRYKIEQVFTNLINNAIKYSPNGGDILIKLYQEDESLLVDIVDQGLGIPKEALPKLFTKFFRIDNSDRRRIGGTGLGLSIVQEILKAHNAKIRVHSDNGKGSTFTCIFPLVPAQCDLIPSATPRESGYKVMVVEDDHSLGQLISQELKDSGFQVSYYKRGMDALYALKKEVPDAIVLDILIEEEEIDGWRIMEEVKKQDILKNIPIFVSSALDEKEKGYSLGATDYLLKPYKPSQLSKVIMQTLLKMGKNGQVYIPQEQYEDEE